MIQIKLSAVFCLLSLLTMSQLDYPAALLRLVLSSPLLAVLLCNQLIGQQFVSVVILSDL